MKLKIAGLTNDSIVDGEGYRFTIFVQGCFHHCRNCQNPQTWDINGGYEIDSDTIIKKILDNPILSGVTFSGGEPFLQPKPLIDIAKKIHEKGMNVWTFTGFTFEELISKQNNDINELLHNIDVLVDGKFVEELKDLSLFFRGSKNQRIINIKKTFENKNIVLQKV